MPEFFDDKVKNLFDKKSKIKISSCIMHNTYVCVWYKILRQRNFILIVPDKLGTQGIGFNT
jgi:hypothetical protein